ncbi:uncharacterized protein DUF1992 [Humibacillus xanthopallidus]|uniref:Uncharacterized protein DUF1992 n=1 Tax=Humibacillus xanthopallidus TaxID=412689 RepID=A0A543PNW7_9MICO|nr:DUF1992 domain-containing protein [Humibacillus xanthopallidus]TQN45778.1 uncharacterized protein DUF1992 [Humibacillus xanthopallidus]
MASQPSWESPVEKQIREAQERGDFDNLPGAGKPLDLSDSGDPDWWLKRFAARENLDLGGALPGALALRKEAAGYPASLVDVRTEANVREVIEDYNKRVLADRLRPAVGNLPPMLAKTLDVDEMVAQWRILRGEVEAQERRARVEREAAQRAEQEREARQGRQGRGSWWRRLLARG